MILDTTIMFWPEAPSYYTRTKSCSLANDFKSKPPNLGMSGIQYAIATPTLLKGRAILPVGSGTARSTRSKKYVRFYRLIFARGDCLAALRQSSSFLLCGMSRLFRDPLQAKMSDASEPVLQP